VKEIEKEHPSEKGNGRFTARAFRPSSRRKNLEACAEGKAPGEETVDRPREELRDYLNKATLIDWRFNFARINFLCLWQEKNILMRQARRMRGLL